MRSQAGAWEREKDFGRVAVVGHSPLTVESATSAEPFPIHVGL